MQYGFVWKRPVRAWGENEIKRTNEKQKKDDRKEAKRRPNDTIYILQRRRRNRW